MRSLSIQVQPERSPGIDMGQVRSAFEAIARARDLVTHHAFDHGDDSGVYFNYTFGTPRAADLWQLIQKSVYDDSDLGPHMRRASMAMCSSEGGWNDYLLLYHFDPAVKLDAATDLQEPEGVDGSPPHGS